MARHQHVSGFYLSQVYLALGETEPALGWLETAAEERRPPDLKNGPVRPKGQGGRPYAPKSGVHLQAERCGGGATRGQPPQVHGELPGDGHDNLLFARLG